MAMFRSVHLRCNVPKRFTFTHLGRCFCPRHTPSVCTGQCSYCGDSIRGVRERVKAWAMERPRAYWMPMCGVVELSATTALVGHGGWADGAHR